MLHLADLAKLLKDLNTNQKIFQRNAVNKCLKFYIMFLSSKIKIFCTRFEFKFYLNFM